MKGLFTLEYAENESKLFPEHYHSPGLLLKTGTIPKGTKLQGYVDHSITADRDYTFRRFFIGEKLWMTTTPLEMASHYVPIGKAKGHIGVAGLGMGYFVVKAMAKNNVRTIDVYEVDDRVISYFKLICGDKKGFHKVRFIQGNVFQTCVNKEYDFFYNDIYIELGTEKAKKDSYDLYCKNIIHDFHYWGMELDIYEKLGNQHITAIKMMEDNWISKFFRLWCDFNKKYLELEKNDKLFLELTKGFDWGYVARSVFHNPYN